MKTNLRIGEILTERGYVSQAQMEEALAYQKEHRDRRVGQILIELHFVTEQQVLEALASRLEMEIVDVAAQRVDLDAVAMLDKELAEKNLFLPLSVKNHTMVLVTNDPLNYFALEEARQQTGCYLDIRLSEENRCARRFPTTLRRWGPGRPPSRQTRALAWTNWRNWALRIWRMRTRKRR